MFTGHVDKSGEISFSKKVKNNNSKWRLELYLITTGNYNGEGIFPTSTLTFPLVPTSKKGELLSSTVFVCCSGC